jgi:hypothetical protein
VSSIGVMENLTKVLWVNPVSTDISRSTLEDMTIPPAEKAVQCDLF